MDVAINSVAPNGHKADESNNTNHTNGVNGTNGTASSHGFTPDEPRQVGSYPKTGIDVLIVGTGLAGLSAAIECTRKGHNVRILERNSTINVAGDMYFMGLSATRFFKHWPEMAKEYDDISLHNAWIETYKHSGEHMIQPMKVSERLRAQGLDPNTPPGAFQMRPLVYKMFVKQVEKLGLQIEYNQKVIDYYEDEATGKAGAITEDGKRHEADVVIAADGVGSKSQRLVGKEVRARSSGRAMWRAAFPIENLEKDPEAKEFFKLMNGEDPIVRTFLGPATYALTLTRPDTMIWIMNHDATGSEAESWHNYIPNEEVLEGMDKIPGPHKWAPIFKQLVACTPPQTTINFELLWRNPQPSWTSKGARVIQIGDSAHSFLPSSGNGATQAIEDAISLASCLQIGGKENIPQSVRAHIRLRFVRNACAQKLGFANAELLQDTDWQKVKLNPRVAAPRLPRWVFAHDPENYAYENYDHVVSSMKKGIAIEDDTDFPPNYPPGYKYEPWSIDDIMEDIRAGKPVELVPGDWS